MKRVHSFGRWSGKIPSCVGGRYNFTRNNKRRLVLTADEPHQHYLLQWVIKYHHFQNVSFIASSSCLHNNYRMTKSFSKMRKRNFFEYPRHYPALIVLFETIFGWLRDFGKELTIWIWASCINTFSINNYDREVQTVFKLRYEQKIQKFMSLATATWFC